MSKLEDDKQLTIADINSVRPHTDQPLTVNQINHSFRKSACCTGRINLNYEMTYDRESDSVVVG